MKHIPEQRGLFSDIAVSVIEEPFDVCAGKHGGNAQSIEADKTTDKGSRRVEIVNWLISRGNGTGKEFGKFRGIEFNTYSGRFRELRDWKIIRYVLKDVDETLTREKSAVYTVTDNFQRALDVQFNRTGKRDVKVIIDDFRRACERV